MNRREFLQAASAFTTAAALPSLAGASALPARRMTIALTPGSIGVSVKKQKEIIALAARHQFESVEPRAEELAAMSAAQVAEIQAELKE